MAQLPINQGFGYVHVDDNRYDELAAYAWSGHQGETIKTTYRREGKVGYSSLAQMVTGEKLARGHKWIHLDGDRRNFRRENLAMMPRHEALNYGVTTEEKSRRAKRGAARRGRRDRQPIPASGYRGVAQEKNKFKARITIQDKMRHLGLFETPEQAGYAYDLALKAEGLEPVNKPALDDLAAEAVRQAVTKKLEQWV